jgi:serine/threonine protein kinase
MLGLFSLFNSALASLLVRLNPNAALCIFCQERSSPKLFTLIHHHKSPSHNIIFNPYRYLRSKMVFEDDSMSTNGEIQPGQATYAKESEVDAEAAKAASEAAFVRVMEFEANSNLMRSPEECHDVTRLEWDDVAVEGLLGVGGFACVCKVSVPVLELEDDPADDFENDDNDDRTSHTGTSTSSFGSGCYALKCLNQRTTMDRDTFVTGAADLASEFLLLSNLRHDNIVRLFGVSHGCVSNAFRESGGYFLLLELLRGTVSDLLRLWREDLKDITKAAKIPSPLERVQGIALGVAKGMEYLHQNNVVLRDLKPHNVGFDRDGNVRLFDFGLAREIVTDSTTTDLSIPGVAGSYRYMAPEVALGEGSVFGSDVYSFGMLLWELLTLAKPYEKIKYSEEFKQKVAIQGLRPSCKNIPTPHLKDLLKDCWDREPLARPSFTDACKVLGMELCISWEQLEQKPCKRQSWRDQFKALKKTVQYQIRERRRSQN